MLNFESVRKVPLHMGRVVVFYQIGVQTGFSDFNRAHVLAQSIYFMASEMKQFWPHIVYKTLLDLGSLICNSSVCVWYGESEDLHF